MTPESAQKLRELEAERKVAQERLFRHFIDSPCMTVLDYEHRSQTINTKFAREQAMIILEAIMQTEQAQ